MDKIFNVEIDGQITLPDGRKLGPFEETTVNVVQPSEGGSDPVSKGVKFIDHDGTVVATWETSTVASKTALPDNPTHDGLTAQGWNWSLAEIQSYIADYPDALVTVGQMYITDDGKTRIYIHLEEGRLSPYLGICPNGSVDIDWGDGSAHDTVTGTSDSTVISTQHTYASGGDYVISLTVTGNMGIVGSSSYASQLLWKNSTTTKENLVYQNSVQKLEIGSGVTSIGTDAFEKCDSLGSIIIPNSVTSIGLYAFGDCYSLGSIIIPNSVTSIGTYAFGDCYSLGSIIIPNSVTSIGTYAFENCYSLGSVIIPNSVTSINDHAFSSCYSLGSVIIPNSVTSIGTYAFSACYSLGSVIIPNSVTSIGNSAFSGCDSLGSVIILSGVTSIGSSAFSGCYSLGSIIIPSGVTSIGSSAFSGCYSLRSVIIPNSVTSIGNSVFQNCYSLGSIIIPSGVTSINNYAFQNCYGLGFIKFTRQIPPTVYNNAWSSVPTDCIIYVPTGTLSAYQSATRYPSPSTYTYVEY